MIALENASLIYQDHGKEVGACRNISLTLCSGEFLGILGPSGSGKSSLLYLMSGLKQPTSGTIKVNNKDLSSLSDPQRASLRLQEFGFVFQHPFLLGYLTAIENVLAARPDRSHTEEAGGLLEHLGLKEKLHRHPHELSGGERQRVCIARALLGKPKVIFADEPTASLDHQNGVAVINLLNEMRGEGALVVVTHDPLILAQSNRIITIEDGNVSRETISTVQ